MTKVKFNFILLLLFILVSCQNSIPETTTVLPPSPSQTPILTITPSSTPTLSLSLTPSTTPYPTFPPYSTKQVIFSYSVYGNQSSTDFLLGYAPQSIIVLYSDGELIISGKPYRQKQYQQKQLSSEEINQLFSQLEVMGFYSLETNQQHDTTDLLYDFKGQYGETNDGLRICILDSAKDRKICVRDHLREFLIPQMKNILQFLDNYEPQNMALYQSNRLLLEVKIRQDEINDHPEIISWPIDFPLTKTNKSEILYIEGEMASQIFSLFGFQEDGRVVNSNGVEYYVIVRLVLPHETLSWDR